MGNGGNAIFPPLKGGKMGNGKLMGNGGKCFRSSQQAKMEWKYNDKWVDYLSVLESAIPILLSSVTRLRSLGVTVGVAAPRKWQVTWKERVQMKEGESTGNGSCGDSTAAAGAAGRCTWKRSSRLAPEGGWGGGVRQVRRKRRHQDGGSGGVVEIKDEWLKGGSRSREIWMIFDPKAALWLVFRNRQLLDSRRGIRGIWSRDLTCDHLPTAVVQGIRRGKGNCRYCLT